MLCYKEVHKQQRLLVQTECQKRSVAFSTRADPVHQRKTNAGENKGKMDAHFPGQMLVTYVT
jgi:hypothetical protein